MKTILSVNLSASSRSIASHTYMFCWWWCFVRHDERRGSEEKMKRKTLLDNPMLSLPSKPAVVMMAASQPPNTVI